MVWRTLEAHTDRIIRTLFGITSGELLARFRADTSYVAEFRASYPDGLTHNNIVDAIAVLSIRSSRPTAASIGFFEVIRMHFPTSPRSRVSFRMSPQPH
jgi:hypothetical protein